MRIYEEIAKNMKGTLLKDAPIRAYTYMKIGGPADMLAIPDGYEDLLWLVSFLKKRAIRYFIMGNGTNLLFSDNGFRGVVIKTNDCFNGLVVSQETIFAGSGVDLMTLIVKSALSGFSCLEKLAGIPGTVGGAVWMNAGAFGKEIKDCIKQVRYLDIQGSERTERINFSYRQSPFEKGDIIIGALFIFKRGEQAEIEREIEAVKRSRKEKQPLDYPSAGSVFRNPDGQYAGEIIDRLGMKQMRIGDAEISEKHANFIINRGNASCDDVKQLIHRVMDRVKRAEGIDLELEVEFVPEK